MNLEDLFSLKGRTALVTGGSRGIGRMIVEGFLAAGIDRVYITARKAEELQATADELGDKVVGIQGDISSMEGIEALVADISGRESKLDILVNNAGAAWGNDYLDFPEAGWDKVMDLNVKTPFFLTQKLHGLLTAAASQDRPAKVINITSIDGQRVNPWETYSYQASKAALIHLTRRIAARLVKDHIYVTSLAPGAFPSNMNKVARDHAEASAQGIPNKRVGDKFDMGGTAVYLASRAGDYTVGETLTVDGGIVNAHLPSHFAEPV
ncbi:SDR family oxidoreductase [Alteriqipengyuania flavescens]|uniref:SDR family oxidoreductase n=1 Tax=Alteriqipengyuania flavescens TaxID=3053610 RepID=UPI0025B4BEEC|nr:SDR family oxidoreductase [Alteriqipengyuania flavescens]WJY17740.1 SDR family oxidoreductase [Alteriqipengyuania flavescens]WJY23683.1 SDR family oxidoreductase [Alteriqipengyuania flavescens]